MTARTKLTIAAALVLTSIGSAAVGASFLGPKGKFKPELFGGGFEYDPDGSSCYKPTKPYSDSEYAWSSYRTSVQSYAACLKRNAESDMDYANEQIQEGYNKAIRDFTDEIKRGY